MNLQVWDALHSASHSASIMVGSQHRTVRGSGAARASRTKSEISSRQRILCFDLDSTPLALRRIKNQALRGNKEFPACRSLFQSKPSLLRNNPRLEARASRCPKTASVESVVFAPRPAYAGTQPRSHPCASQLGLKALRPDRQCYAAKSHAKPNIFSSLLPRSVSAEPRPESLRERDGKKLAAILILGFSLGMSATVITGSKLSASLTRPRRRLERASCRGQLGKGAVPPFHPPSCLRRFAAEVYRLSVSGSLYAGDVRPCLAEVLP